MLVSVRGPLFRVFVVFQTVYVDAAEVMFLSHSTSYCSPERLRCCLTIDTEASKSSRSILVSVIQLFVRSKTFKVAVQGVWWHDCATVRLLLWRSLLQCLLGIILILTGIPLSSEEANYPLMNRAIAEQYPSGSTIKHLLPLPDSNTAFVTEIPALVLHGFLDWFWRAGTAALLALSATAPLTDYWYY